MRYQEFRKSSLTLIVEEIVSELRTNPNSLQKFMQTGQATQLTAGFEAELVFPFTSSESGNDEGEEAQLDWDQDERTRNFKIHEVAEWFLGDHEFNGQRDVDRLETALLTKFEDWVDEKWELHWKKNSESLIRDYIEDNLSGSEDEIEEMIQDALENSGEHYDDAREDARNDFYDSEEWGGMSDFWEDQNLESMRDVYEEFSGEIFWPYVIYDHSNNVTFRQGVEELVYDFQEKLDTVVEINDSYHGQKKDNRSWYFEPDSSIESDDDNGTGVEIISPPMPIQEMMGKMEELFAWAKDNGAASNESTGLHIGLSLPDGTPDYIKLVLFLGDKHVLEQFGREANTYTKAAVNQIKGRVSSPQSGKESTVQNALDLMRDGMITAASRIIFAKNTEKYISVNQHPGYVEFRSMGGDYLNMLPVIKNTVMRFAQAYVVASDPTAYKQEYAKKLAKLINPGDNDELAPFVEFALGFKRKEEIDNMYRANGAEDQIIPMSTAKQNLIKDMKAKLRTRRLPPNTSSSNPITAKASPFKPAPLPGTDVAAKKKLPPDTNTTTTDKLAGLPWSRWTVVDTAGRHYYVSARDEVEARTRMLADYPEFTSSDITNIVHQ